MSTALDVRPSPLHPPGAPVARGDRWESLRARGSTLFVLGVWAAMLLVVLGAIARWGRDMPLAEDWLMVAPLTGNEPDLAGWIWSQINEHRVPLARVVYLGLLLAAGGDFRVGMVASALLLGALALAMAWTARRLRGGRSRWTDAFFPVLFLHLGNWDNIVWGWQIQFTLSTAVACTLLLVIVRAGSTLDPRAAWLAVACLLLLPLCGANGLVYALALAPWAAWAGWRTRMDVAATRGARTAGTALVAAAPLAVLLVGLYFVDYQEATWNPPSPSHVATLWTAARTLALAWGPVARASWWLSVFAVVALLAPTALLILWTAWRALRRRDDQLRAWGLLSFAGGTLVLILSIGWGRAGSVPQWGIPVRYALLAAPALCVAYFAWELYGRGHARFLVQANLCLVMLLLLVDNTKQGFGWRDWYLRGVHAVEQDLARGATAAEMAATHRQFLMHWDEAYLRARLEMLRRAEVGPFARLRP